ncbi:MAG TPA: cache domain-containing protein [Syntrophorhabdaceae bacterium]|jgi:signal transduction histidine kinase
MKRIGFIVAAVVMVVFGFVCMSQASSVEDAKAMAEKAAAFWKANGKDKAIAEFNNSKGQFVKGDLYIVAHDFRGMVLAHGVNATLVGKNLYEQKDPNGGRYFVKEEIEIAKTKGSGWITYSWANPATKSMQAKKSWVQRIQGEDAFVLCGVFQ